MRLRSHGSKDLQALSNQKSTRKSRARIKTRQEDSRMAENNNQGVIPPAVNGETAEQRQRREALAAERALNEAEAQRQREIAAQIRGGQQVPQRRVTLGEQDAPHANYRNRSAINPPAIQRQDYEIKPQIIALVKQNQFHGNSNENPMDHIDVFEEICNTTSSNGVPPDYLRCKLFPFSLNDKAHRWLKSLQPGSLTSWEQCRAAFLQQFFTKSRSAALKNKIATFQQGATESFYEAWDRYKEYLRDCPPRSYTESDRMNFFYNGIEQRYQMALDTASKGDFSSNTLEEATQLIENLATSNANRCPEYDRRVKTPSGDKAMEDLTAKIDMLLKAQKRPVHMVDDHEFDDEMDGAEEINFLGGQGNYQNRGFNQNYRNHPNLSYRSTNVENPGDQFYPPRNTQAKPFNQGFQGKAGYGNAGFNSQNGNAGSQDRIDSMFQQILEDQKRFAKEINAKVDGMYNDLNGKFDALGTHVKVLENQVAQTTARVKAQPVNLPGKSEANLREHLSFIELRNGKRSVRRINPSEIDRSIIEIDRSEDELSDHSMDDDEIDRSEGDFSDHSMDDEIEEYLKEQDRQYEIDQANKARREMNIREDRSIQDEIDRSPVPDTQDEPDEQDMFIDANQIPTRNKMPPVSRTTMDAYDDWKVARLAKEMRVRLPFKELDLMIPLLEDHLKYIMTGQTTPEESVRVLQQECSKRMHEKLPPKLGDPGRFILSCTIGNTRLKSCLVDSGASVNVMPLSISRELGLLTMQPTAASLLMADGSTQKPLGLLVDIPILVGTCYLLMDFMVLKLDDNGADLILGRLFLATAGVSINVSKGMVKIRLKKTVVKLYVETFNTHPTVDGQTFVVDECNVIDEVQSMDVTPRVLTHEVNFPYKDKVKEEESLAHISEALTAPQPVIDAERHGPDEETTVPLMGRNLI